MGLSILLRCFLSQRGELNCWSPLKDNQKVKIQRKEGDEVSADGAMGFYTRLASELGVERSLSSHWYQNITGNCNNYHYFHPTFQKSVPWHR